VVLLMPIAVRERVVAIVVGHGGADVLSVTESSELLPLAGAAGEALARGIANQKRGARAPGATPRRTAGTSETAATQAPAPARQVAPSVDLIAHLLDPDHARRAAAVAGLRAASP